MPKPISLGEVRFPQNQRLYQAGETMRIHLSVAVHLHDDVGIELARFCEALEHCATHASILREVNSDDVFL
jgi:hypothetical protein